MTRHDGRRALRAALWVAAAVALAGCQTYPTNDQLARHDYRLKHPIVIGEQAETMEIPVSPDARRLSRDMEHAAVDFARAARADGARYVEILVPSGSANEAAAHSVAAYLRHAMAKAGVAPQSIEIRAYPVNDYAAIAPVRLAYPKVKASVHECGRWTESLTAKSDNSNHPDYGCATQSNLAAMVDDPVDLIRPAASGPADRARRDTVHGKYRQGEVPSGQYKEGVGAKVSDVGN